MTQSSIFLKKLVARLSFGLKLASYLDGVRAFVRVFGWIVVVNKPSCCNVTFVGKSDTDDDLRLVLNND